jgi:hypothetical protein
MTLPSHQKTRKVLQALIEGVDPDSGAELPRDTVVHRPAVIRALLASVAALDALQARALRRAQLPASVGKTWSNDEERQLREEFAGGEPIPLIATKHTRTIRAIEARLERIGLLRADQRTTSNIFTGAPNIKEGKE